jgi:hypothetical protein|tara:strand:- start:114 stop:380 length:267 start_codon:yes stop_codon:yes gene_type:complete
MTNEKSLTVRELYEFLQEVIKTDEERGDWPISVAFDWKGDTVLSDIISANINGKSIQLNEDEFMLNLNELRYPHYNTQYQTQLRERIE